MSEKCPNCGAPLNDGKCDYCGYQAQTVNPVNNSQAQPQSVNVVVNNATPTNTNTVYAVGVSPKSRTAAALLCFFLGVLGVHRFYVGKIGTGIIWLFTAGFFGIGALIDFIKILCGTFADKNGFPLKNWSN